MPKKVIIFWRLLFFNKEIKSRIINEKNIIRKFVAGINNSDKIIPIEKQIVRVKKRYFFILIIYNFIYK